MTIKCEMCGMELLVEGELQDGQNVSCPYCNQKFMYHREESQSKRLINSGRRRFNDVIASVILGFLVVICGLFAVGNFLDGCFSIPEISDMPNSWNGNIAELQAQSCKLTHACFCALVSIGKILLGWIFARLTVGLFRLLTKTRK